MPDVSTEEQLRQANALRERAEQLMAMLVQEHEAEWDDRDQPEDAAIALAFPTKTNDHATYAEALRLVGARRSKASLVALVNWLLVRTKERRDAAIENTNTLLRAEIERLNARVADADAEILRLRGHLDCDHCGDVAIRGDKDGLYTDGAGGACMSCGFPGSVSCDEETPPYWNTGYDTEGAVCTREDCDECAELRENEGSRT